MGNACWQFVVGVGLLCTRDELCVGWLNWWLVVDAAVTAALLASDHAVRYQLLRAEINWKNAGSFYQERPRACTRNQWDAMRANQVPLLSPAACPPIAVHGWLSWGRTVCVPLPVQQAEPHPARKPHATSFSLAFCQADRALQRRCRRPTT
jgi:hypothetical protein